MREFAIFLALNQELADLHREEIRRSFQSTGPSLGDRVTSVLRSVRAAVNTPAESLTPSLSDNASRS